MSVRVAGTQDAWQQNGWPVQVWLSGQSVSEKQKEPLEQSPSGPTHPRTGSQRFIAGVRSHNSPAGQCA